MRNFFKPFIRAAAFIGKEINEVRRQPRLVLSLILGPFLILLLFGIGYQGDTPTWHVEEVVTAEEDLLFSLPKELRATLKEKASVVCDLRLTVNDLLAQMVYEGNVKVLSDDGNSFTFDSPEAVSWLQMYVDMVAAGTVDNTALTTKDDRVGLLIFSAGQAPFYQTGPNLIREVKANNAQLYEDLAVVPAPVGKSGVIGKGLMGMSVKADTKYPNASMALAQFFTNARTMVELAKQSAVYPSSAKAFEDPYFSSTPEAIEDSARPIAGETIAKYADIVPTIPNKGDVNAVVLAAVEKALFGGVSAQQALSDAVVEANKLLD